MKRFIVGIASIALLASLTGLAQAQAGSSPESNTIAGTVQSLSSTQIVIKTDAGQNRTFDFETTADRPAGLRVGDRVQLGFRTDTGQMLVTRVDRMSQSMSEGSQASPSNQTTSRDPNAYGEGDLPRTASPWALVAVAGLASLAGGVALRRRTRAR